MREREQVCRQLGKCHVHSFREPPLPLQHANPYHTLSPGLLTRKLKLVANSQRIRDTREGGKGKGGERVRSPKPPLPLKLLLSSFRSFEGGRDGERGVFSRFFGTITKLSLLSKVTGSVPFPARKLGKRGFDARLENDERDHRT